MKYSVWIVPPQPIFDEVSEIIGNLAHKYKGPIFMPHLTVLVSIDRKLSEIENAVKTATNRSKKFKLSFGPVSFSTTYFQSVLVRIDSTSQLLQLNLDIKKLLEIENNVFMPHISLIYGNHDMETREIITKQIELQSRSFIVDKVEIVPEKSDPSEWKPIVTIPINE